MATTISTLAVKLTANTMAFSKGMRRAAKLVNRFGERIFAAGKRVAKYGAVLTTAAIGGMALLIKRQMALIDTAAKVSDKLGVNIAELQGLRLAAQLSGVEIRTLDMGLQRFIRRVSEAAHGTGEAKAALKELGFDEAALAATRPLELFKQVADRMAAMTSQADRVRLSFKLFDSEGVALVNTLLLGRKRIEEITEQATRMGLAFSRIDAAQVEAANDALRIMRATIEGLVTQLTIQLAPFITAMTDEFTAWATAGTTGAERIDTAMRKVLKTAAYLADVTLVLEKAWLEIESAGLWLYENSALAKWLTDYKNVELAQAMRQLNLEDMAALPDIGAWGKDALAELKRIQDKAKAIARKATEGAAISTGMPGYDKWAAESGLLARKGKAATVPAVVVPVIDTAALEKTHRQLMSWAERWEDATQTPAEKFEQSLYQLNRAVDAGFLSWEKYSRGVELANKELQDALDVGEKVADLSARIMTIADPATMQLGPAIEAGTAEAFRAQWRTANRVTGSGAKTLQKQQVRETQNVRKAVEDVKTAVENAGQGVGVADLIL